MTDIAPWRLNLLRAGYLLLVVGLGPMVWPAIATHLADRELMHGVVLAMLGALSALAVLGLRYPLYMLPLLFWELAWKSIWLVAVARPLWAAHHLAGDSAETAYECLMAVVFLVTIPWDYVWRTFAARSGEPWRRARAATSIPVAS